MYYTNPVACPSGETLDPLLCIGLGSQAISLTGTSFLPAYKPAKIASLQVPAGAYLVSANVGLEDTSYPEFWSVTCVLQNSALSTIAIRQLFTSALVANIESEQLTLDNVYVAASQDTITLLCAEALSGQTQVYDAVLTALPIANLTTQ